MHILCIGLNHTTAPVSLRERLAFDEENLRATLARLSCGDALQSTNELILLSTCNRVELYAVSSTETFTLLESFLAEARGVQVSDFSANLYRLKDRQVVHHLLNVAAGLDSLVLGEPQILGQVTRALELARGVGAAGPLLSRLFQVAIYTGKRARSETLIGVNPTSISSLAAGLCAQKIDNLKRAQIVVLGAGEMAELAVEALRKRGAAQLVVVNRTLARAQALAQHWDARAATFEDMPQLLAEADILIASTSAPHTLITPQMVIQAMQSRPQRPLVLVDIAVPRDIDPDVARVKQVHLFDIDHLNVQLEHFLADRSREAPDVQKVVAEEEALFCKYLETLDMLPLIVELHQQAEAIRQVELDKTLRRLPDLTSAERERIEALTHALVKKLLAQPTQRLRAEAARPHASEYAALTRTLFGLTAEIARGGSSTDARHAPASPSFSD